jgi:hypothetical protein
LVEFLDEKLSGDIAAEDAARELQLGVSLGVIPQETFDDFVGRESGEVMGDVSVAGGVMGLEVVNSPRGLRFCQEVLGQLRG